MFEYFKLLEDYIGDTSYQSISDITIKLMSLAGYSRECVSFKNGNTRIRTVYSNKFDDRLTAMWLLYYKKLFIAKLSKHPELTEYQVDIINKTFLMVIKSLQIEKIVSDDVVHKYVNLTLSSRIKEMMWKNKSKYSTETYERGKKLPYKLKGALDNQAISINQDFAKDIITDSSMICPDLLDIDIRDKVKNSVLARKLYESMLQSKSKSKFSLKSIDTTLGLPISMCDDNTKKIIVDAYNMFKELVLSYSDEDIVQRFRKLTVKSVKYSFEE